MFKWIIAIGVVIVSLLVILSFFGALPWAATGVLSTVVIGIVGWILSYLSKAKGKTTPQIKGKLPEIIEPLKQPRVILEETCEIDGREYIYYDLDLNKGKKVKGEVSSDERINLFFLTKYAFSRFKKNEDFSYEYGSESILKKRIHFTPSKTGTWYFVLENEGEDTAIVDIHLFV